MILNISSTFLITTSENITFASASIFRKCRGAGKSIVFTHIFILSIVLSFLIMFQYFFLYHFLFVSRNSFSYSFRTGLLVKNSLSFPSLENVLISPLHSWRILSLDIRFWYDNFFQHLKNISPFLSGLHVFWWKISCQSYSGDESFVSYTQESLSFDG